MTSNEAVSVYFNARCSKCRGARELLEARDVQATYVHYLETAPTRAELERLMAQLGITSPRATSRAK